MAVQFPDSVFFLFYGTSDQCDELIKMTPMANVD